MKTDSVDFSPDVELFLEEFSGWSISLSGISNFSVDGTWHHMVWSVALADMVEDVGLCIATNTVAKTITISNCQ